MKKVTKWRISTGEHFNCVQVASNKDYVTAMAAIGKRKFVAGTSSGGTLLLFSQSNGRNLQEITDEELPHLY